MTRTVLVFGGGQVARELAAASPSGWRLQTVPRGDADITDAAAVQAAIAKGADIVVNAAAWTAVERAEDEAEQAFAVNRDGAANIANACADAGLPLIHLSTDYVFDGAKDASYAESDPVNPLNVYGASKAAGEAAVRAAQPDSVILRTAWVFAPHGHNFVRTMLRLAHEREEIAVVDDQTGCPTAARDIAHAVLDICAAIGDGATPRGLWHYCGTPPVTWYGFAEAIFAAAAKRGMKAPALRRISTAEFAPQAPRPANTALDCAAIARDWGIAQPDWRAALDDTVAALMAGEELQA